MDGIGGKPGWAWIFSTFPPPVLEGLLTILAGLLSFFIIQDFPDTARFLTPSERRAVIRRLKEDDQWSAEGEAFAIANVWKSLGDWKSWVGMVVYAGADMPLYAFSLFLPSIINQVGVWFSLREVKLIFW